MASYGTLGNPMASHVLGLVLRSGLLWFPVDVLGYMAGNEDAIFQKKTHTPSRPHRQAGETHA